MRYLRLPAVAVLVVALGAVLAGCSSKGAGSSNIVPPPSSTVGGTITGSVNALSLARSRAALVTVSVDGTDRSVQVAPGATFTLTDVPPGLQTLVVYTADHAFAMVIGVEKNKAAQVGDLALTNAGQISGIVRDADTGDALDGAVVTVTESVTTNATTQLPSPVRSIRTNSFGSYTLYGLPVGDYLVEIGKPGYDAATLALTVTTGTTVGDAKLTKNATTGQTGSVSGVVNTTTAAGDVQTLAGAMVRLVPPSTDATEADQPVPPTATLLSADGQPTGGTVNLRTRGRGRADTAAPAGLFAFTAADGTYKITGVPVGSYLAVAVRAGMDAAHQSVTVSTNTDSPLTFTLAVHQTQTGTVKGVVVDDKQAPVAGAAIYAMLSQAEPPALLSGASSGKSRDTMVGATAMVLKTTTGSDGSFTLVVPTSVTTLGIAAPNYTPAQATVVVTAGGTTDAGTITLTPIVQQTGTLQGSVVDAGTGAGIANATVQAIAGGVAVPMSSSAGVVASPLPPIPAPLTTTTDAQGGFTLTVPVQVQTLLVYADKYDTQRVAVTVTNGATVQVKVSMTLFVPPTATVSGTVTSHADGTPIANAQVSALFGAVPTKTRDGAGTANSGSAAATPVTLVTQTDANGAYSFVVPMQATAIGAVAPGFAPQAVPVTLTAGGTATANLQLAPLAGTAHVHVISGTVYATTAAGTREPAVNATVGAAPTLSAVAAFFTTQTDREGHFRLPVPDGAYSVGALRNGLASDKQSLTISADITIELVLPAPLLSALPPLGQ